MTAQRNSITRRALGALVIASLTIAAQTRAQQRPEPRLTIAITGGVAFGGSLWAIDRQPVLIEGFTGEHDTLALERTFHPGITAGLTAVLFRTPHLGITAEAVFLGLGIDDNCRMVAENAQFDPQRRNRQLCDDITRRDRSSSTVAFALGGVYRAAPRSFAAPYVRLQGGLVVRNSSLIETAGQVLSDGVVEQRVVIRDDSPTAVGFHAGVAVGVMIPLAPGYQVQLELKDHVLQVEQVTGPADNAIAPTRIAWDHAPALTMAIGIVLEQRRGRRY